MTMAASFQFKDGVVFCADRLITHGDATIQPAFASYETKIWATDGFGFAAMITGAGDTHVIKSLADAILQRLTADQGSPDEMYRLPKQIIKPIFEEELANTYSKLIPAEGADLLLAVNLWPFEIVVLRNKTLTVNAAKSNEVVGIGENSLIRFLIESLHSETLSYEEAVTTAAFVVFAAKKYCPQYCGGHTDIFTLRRQHPDHLEEPEEEIKELESLFEREAATQLRFVLSKAAKLIKLGQQAMTHENRQLISLDEIVAIEYQCKTCGTRVSVPRKKWGTHVQRECPRLNCGLDARTPTPWIRRDAKEEGAVISLQGAILELIEWKEAGCSLSLEIHTNETKQ